MSKSRLDKSRVLIVDAHPLFREGLKQMIGQEPSLTVCGEVADADQALKAAAELKPHLVVAELALGTTNGIDLIKSLKNHHRGARVLVISAQDETLYAERVLRAGALGYVMKHESIKATRTAILKVLAGDIHLSDRMSSVMLAKFTQGKDGEPMSPLGTLSDRELEVFQLLGQGKGTRQIAQEIKLTFATISSFRARIKNKLGLKSSAELVLHAIQWNREGGPGNRRKE